MHVFRTFEEGPRNINRTWRTKFIFSAVIGRLCMFIRLRPLFRSREALPGQ